MKRYLLRTLLYLLPLLALLAYYLFIVDHDAMKGDLGRLAQKEFHYTHPPLDPNAPRSDCRDVDVADIEPRDADELVVFGDSFTAENTRRWPNCRWHQFMGGLLGKRIVVAGYFQEPVKEFLSALTYYPEALGDTVILQSGERLMVYRLCYLDFDHIGPPMTTSQQPDKGRWRKVWRKTSKQPIEYYKKQLGLDMAVLQAPLKRACFSVRPQKLFFYKDDLMHPSEWEYSHALENLKRLDSLAHAYGKTIFFVAVPEKYTTYRNQIINPPDTIKRTLEAPCLFDTETCFINTLPVIDSLVESGTLDVYLPDDTHFSIPTAQAVGQYVARRISGRP